MVTAYKQTSPSDGPSIGPGLTVDAGCGHAMVVGAVAVRVDAASRPVTAGLSIRGLKRGVLSPLETLAQSIAGIAPSATPGMLVPIVFGFSGNGTWLAYLLATVGILFTAQCINEFASRSACPGSLYSFVTQGFGHRAGILAGCALLFAYVFCGSACVTEFTIYATSVAKTLLNLNIPCQLMMLMCTALVAYVAYKNIKLSATLMLRLEFLSVGLILLLVVLTHLKHGLPFDWQQLSLSGCKVENVRMGLVMAIFGFVGFESAASLGVEAAQPLKSIPRAIMRSVIFSGLFFVLTSYTMILSFHGSTVRLDQCSTPLLAMADMVGASYLGELIDIGIMVSFFAAGLANLNGAARTIYKMSQDGHFFDALSSTHEQNCTPHIAVIVSSTVSLSISLILAAMNCPLLDIVGWLGTLATFGFIFAYLATSVAAARMLKARGEFAFPKQIIVCASACILIFSFVGSLYPVPSFPYNILPFGFAAYMVVASILCLKARQPAIEGAGP